MERMLRVSHANVTERQSAVVVAVILPLITLAAEIAGCGSSKDCLTWEGKYAVTGTLLDAQGDQPLTDTLLEIRLEDESGLIGNVGTAVTDDTGAISAMEPFLTERNPSNWIVTHMADDCIVYFDRWPFGLVQPFVGLGPLPDLSQIVLTLTPDRSPTEITIEFSQDMLQQCNDDHTFCVLDVGTVTVTRR